MNHAHRRRAFVVLLLGALLVTLIVATGAFASPLAGKKAQLRQVQAKLDAIGIQVSKAVEDYDQAASRLDSTRGRIRQNQRLLAIAERNLATANRQLEARAQNIYKAPEVGFINAVLSARSFDDLVTQLDLMQRLGNSDVDLVRSVSAYERDIKDRRVQLQADARIAVKLLAERRAQKSAIMATNARLQSYESSLKADIKRALAQQAAAARAAAQQALAAANAANGAGSVGTSSGGGGAPPPPDPSGPGHPEVVAIAQRYLGIPYVWGGASPSQGFDCSGLVMYVYAQIGIGLSHGATDQRHASTPVPLSALRPGDLVFYGNASYSYHVAIYVGGGRTIEAARTGTPVRYGVVGSAWIGGRL